MAEAYDLQRLLQLRKVTRALADFLRDEMRDHLTTLAPLLNPRVVLGDFVAGGPKAVRGADRAWKDVETQYAAIAPKADQVGAACAARSHSMPHSRSPLHRYQLPIP